MDAEAQNLIKPDEFEIKDKRFFQVDFIKAVMIFLVIYDHTIPWVIKREIGVALWERISIPVFLVIMGFNMGLSFSKVEDKRLRKLYSWKYFKRKFWRYIYPFIVLYIISSLIGLAINGFDWNALNQYKKDGWHFYHLFIGILPFWGPGNWFLPVIFWSILLMPLLYRGFSGKLFWRISTLQLCLIFIGILSFWASGNWVLPVIFFTILFLPLLFIGFSGKLVWRIITLLLCYAIEISIQLAIFTIFPPPFLTWQAYYDFLYWYLFIVTTPFFMLSAIGLGMWFSKKPNLFAKQNIFMWILFPLSLYYLIQYQFFDFRFEVIRGDSNLFVFPYSAFLVLLGIKLLPKRWDNWFARAISTIGKATYHILLTQILYFSVVYSIYGDHYGASIFGINISYDLTIYLYLIINWMICVPCGVFWYYVDFKLRDYYALHKKNKSRIEV
jgi:hypothetical protein